MIENWKDIKGFEGLYKISDLGNIKSLLFNKEHLMHFGNNGHNYMFVYLRKNGIKYRFYVHTLVCEHFNKNPNNYKEVNHINENKLDNRAVNLEWCSHKYNINYGECKNKISKSNLGRIAPNKKITDEQIKIIKDSDLSLSQLGKMFNLTKQTIFYWRHKVS